MDILIVPGVPQVILRVPKVMKVPTILGVPIILGTETGYHIYTMSMSI